MKRRIALLMAVIMVISLLPMNVFGRTARPGVIHPLSHPHGVHDAPEFMTFHIDAAWLSNQPVPVGGHLFLEIETSGGDATGGNMVGMVQTVSQGMTRPSPWPGSPSDPPVGTDGVARPQFQITFAPGEDFRIVSPGALGLMNPTWTVTRPAEWANVTMTRLRELAEAADADANNAFELSDAWTSALWALRGDPGSMDDYTSFRYLANTDLGIDIHWIRDNGDIQASLVTGGWASGLLSSNYAGTGQWGPEYLLQELISPETSVTVGTGAGNIGNLSRLNAYVGHNNTVNTPAIARSASWDGGRDSIDINRHGNRTESRLWSVSRITLENALGFGNSEPGSLVGMEGWINVTVPIQAGHPDATIRVRLGSVTAGGAVSYILTLLEGPLTGGWANGVQIESRGVVPIVGRTRLRPIRITEDRNNILGGPHTVRIVAPRGFRWDTGDMPGMDARGLTASLNSAVFGSNDRLTLRTDGDNPGGIVNPANGTSSVYYWLNPITDRHELYFQMMVPARLTGDAGALATRARIDIEGLSLVTMPGAPTSGEVSVDVYIGAGTEWFAADQVVNFRGDRLEDLVGLDFVRRHNLVDGYQYRTRSPLFGQREESWRVNNWRRLDLVVGTLDDAGLITVDGPSAPFRGMSGTTTAEFATLRTVSPTANAPWMHSGNHTIRLSENQNGIMFRTFEQFELRPVQDGVRIVDVRVRVGHENNRGAEFDWVRPENNDAHFIAPLSQYEDGAFFFSPRTLDLDTLDDADMLLSMEIGLALSIEGGFEAANGSSSVDIEVFRSNEYLGTVTVAEITDPIVVTTTTPTVINRDVFDVIPLTEVASITISEREANTFASGDEIHLALQSVQMGRVVNIPHGAMNIFLSEPIVNEEESGLAIREIPGTNGLGWRVMRPSRSNGEVGSFTFEEVFVAGATVPGIEWRVVVHGPEITQNHLLPGEIPEIRGGGSPNPDALWQGYVTGTANTHTSPYRHYERAVFHSLPYSAVVLEVTGTVLGGIGVGENEGEDGRGPGFVGGAPVTFHVDVAIDGIQPVIFHQFSSTFHTALVSPRVFADHYGLDSYWSDSAQTFTFSGLSRTGEYREVVTTLGSTNVVVDGVTHDIATFVGQQAELGGQIAPILIAGRQYVPVRLLSDVFGIPVVGFNVGVSVSLG